MSDILNLDGSHPGASQTGFQHNTQFSKQKNTLNLPKPPKINGNTNLSKVEEAVKLLHKKYLPDFRVFSISEITKYFPVFVVAMANYADNKMFITYVPYVLLNDTIIELPNKDNRSVSVKTPQEAFFNENLLMGPYRHFIENYIKKNLHVFNTNIDENNVEFNACNFVLINKDTDISTESFINNIFVLNACYVIYDGLVKFSTKKGINLLSDENIKDMFLSLSFKNKFRNKIDYNKDSKHTYNLLNIPVRTDITTTLSRQDEDGEWGLLSQSKPVSAAGGYVDFVIQEVHENGSLFYKLLPRWVQTIYTQLDSDKYANFNSVLMSLVSAAQAIGDKRWITSFRPQPLKKGEKNLKDITGFLPYSGKPYTRNGTSIVTPGLLDFVTPEALDTVLYDFANNYSLDGVLYSMDFPIRSAESFAGDELIDASDNYQEAINYILHMVNAFTNGKFMDFYQSNENPMDTHNSNNLYLPSGTYINKAGVEKDIRTLDLLYHLNLNYEETSNKAEIMNGRILNDYINLFVNGGGNYDVTTRIENMKDHYRMIVGDSVVFTGITKRVTFTTKFINAFYNAVQSMVEIIVDGERLAVNNYNLASHRFEGSNATIQGFSNGPVFSGNNWRGLRGVR